MKNERFKYLKRHIRNGYITNIIKYDTRTKREDWISFDDIYATYETPGLSVIERERKHPSLYTYISKEEYLKLAISRKALDYA